MNDRPARTVFLAVAGLLASAISGVTPVFSAPQQNQADDGYVFVLKLNDEQIEMLKNGQALASFIAPENRGRFSQVRLEYEATPRTGGSFNSPVFQNSSPSFSAGNSQAGVNPIATPGSQILGPSVPEGWRPPVQDFRSSNSGMSSIVPPLPLNQFGNSQGGNTTGNGITPNQGGTVFPGQGNTPSSNPAPGNNWNIPGTGNPTSIPQSPPGNFQDTRANPTVDPNRFATNSPNNNNPSLLTPGNPPRTDNFQDYDNLPAGTANITQGNLLERMQGQATNTAILNSGMYRPGYTNPGTANSWSDYGGRNLLASARDTLASSRNLPMAAIPGAANDPSVSAFRDVTQPTAALEDANRKNAFLFFWLLCSIGLNIYLGWISRGFYVRYRELADELRETFSTV